MKRSKVWMSVLWIFFAAACSCLSADAPTCAVLTFEASGGMTDDEARFVSDRFAALLTQTDLYNVIAREKMHEILKVSEFNRSEFCTATECATQAGKILQVRFIIFGTVWHVGELFSMNTSLVDVETGKIVRSAITDQRGDKTDFLEKGAMQNLRQLVESGEAPAQPAGIVQATSPREPTPVSLTAEPRDAPRAPQRPAVAAVKKKVERGFSVLGEGQLPQDGDAGGGIGIRYQWDFNPDGAGLQMIAQLGYLTGFGESVTEPYIFEGVTRGNYSYDRAINLATAQLGALWSVPIGARSSGAGFEFRLGGGLGYYYVHGTQDDRWTANTANRTVTAANDVSFFALAGFVGRLSERWAAVGEVRYTALDLTLEISREQLVNDQYGALQKWVLADSVDYDLSGVGMTVGILYLF